MPRYDLAGNPLPDEPGSQSQPQPAAPAYGQQFDLAGNPLPTQAPPPQAYPPPAGAGGQRPPYGAPPNAHYGSPPGGAPMPPPPGGYGAPPGSASPYGAPPAYGAPPMGSSYKSPPMDDGKKKKMVIGSIVGVIGFIVGFFLFRIFFPPAVPAPTVYTPYTATNGAFTVDQPNGWEVHTADEVLGKNDDKNVGGVLFTNGTARIDISQTTVAEVKANAMLSMDNGADVLTQSATGRLFKQQHNKAKNNKRNYEEEKPFDFDSQGLEGKSVTFTASGPLIGLGGPTKGYYVALTGGVKAYTIICECRQSDWDNLKPAFQRVVGSIREK